MESGVLRTPELPERRPPERKLGATEWAKKNLFSTWFNSILTVVFGAFLLWLLYKVIRFVFVDADWEIIEVNVVNLLIFRFPRDETWRIWIALFLLAAAIGLAAGVLRRRRQMHGEEGAAEPSSWAVTLRRMAPLLVVVAVFLWFGRSLTATLLVAAIGLTWAGARILSRYLTNRMVRWAGWVAVLGLVGSYVVIVAFGGVGTEQWGGLMLTIFLAVGGIVLCFPIGVLLALGRRSSLPAVRAICVGYIELIRGVPLITILFMGAFMLGFFLPPGTDPPSLTIRALVALIIFSAAYVAEIVRGGLQSVPRGQTEAAQALGLSSTRITLFIVLPQALRAVIPALVGQFISLFKDTSLVAIVGLSELLGVAEAITKQPQFIAQGLIIETLFFAGFVYWCGSYWMSKESQRLEQRLGVGER